MRTTRKALMVMPSGNACGCCALELVCDRNLRGFFTIPIDGRFLFRTDDVMAIVIANTSPKNIQYDSVGHAVHEDDRTSPRGKWS
jgi:hypothetical protein